MNRLWRSVFKTKVTQHEAKDTGMALVLLLLLVAAYSGRNGFLVAAIVLHILNMTAPQIFRPAAVVWLGLSHLIGLVMSRAILTLIFFVVVTPVALWRRISGKDSMRLKEFKAGSASVMVERNHTFTGPDLEQPY